MKIQWSGVNGSRTIVETEAGPHAFDAGPTDDFLSSGAFSCQKQTCY